MQPVALESAQDFIAVYRALEPDLCQRVIEAFDRDPNKRQGRAGRTGAVSLLADTKQSVDLEIPSHGEWGEILQLIHPKIQACVAHYLAVSPVLRSFPLQATGYKIQLYPKQQGYFRWHADSVGKEVSNRVAALVLYLNDVAEGGETEFFHQSIKIPPRTGKLLLFPAGWTYMHCGHMPLSGDKYIISSFIKVRD